MEQNKYINIHSIMEKSTLNGPGNRSVIWFQGCKLDCKGCFNQEIRKIENKKLLSVDDILNKIPVKDIDGVTISGGEPFLQIDALHLLTKKIKKLGLSLIIYTGYQLNDLMNISNEKILEILACTDVLIDGPYIKENQAKHPWAGSGNQNLWFLSNRYHEYENISYEDLGELIITETGEIIETGFAKII